MQRQSISVTVGWALEVLTDQQLVLRPHKELVQGH